MYVCACVCECVCSAHICHTLRTHYALLCVLGCVLFCLLSLCFVFNPFHAKMLRFDFIFCWGWAGLGWVVAFSYFCCILCCALRGQRQFCPRCAIYMYRYYIYILYTYIFNILASKISYYPHLYERVCGLLLYVHVNFICFLRAHKSKKIVFYMLYMRVKYIYVCMCALPFRRLAIPYFIVCARAIFLYAFSTARPFLLFFLFSACFSFGIFPVFWQKSCTLRICFDLCAEIVKQKCRHRDS